MNDCKTHVQYAINIEHTILLFLFSSTSFSFSLYGSNDYDFIMSIWCWEPFVFLLQKDGLSERQHRQVGLRGRLGTHCEHSDGADCSKQSPMNAIQERH